MGPHPTSRVQYLDSLRNYLMLLGIVIHAAQPFRAYTPNTIQLAGPSPIFDYIVDLIHAFRLPAFFLISGYVGSTVIQSRGRGPFLLRRTIRLGVPFVATLFTLNVLETVVTARWLGVVPAGSWRMMVAHLVHQFEKGNLVHLWFLPVLLLYSAGLVLADAVGATSDRVKRWFGALEQNWYALLLPLLVIPINMLAWRIIPAWQRVRWSQLPSPDLVLYYFPFFFFGVLAHRRPLIWSEFGSNVRWYLLSIGGLVTTALLSLSHNPRVAAYAVMCSQAFVSWLLTGIIVLFSRRTLDGPLPKLLRAPDMAYSIYLFHHIFVTLIALMLLRSTLSSGLRFAAITLVAGSLSIGVGFCISRTPALRFAFNGRVS